MYKKNSGFTRVYKAAFYSYKGFIDAARSEAAFQQELVLALILIPLAFWFDVTDVERILLVSSVVLVLIVELLNTGLESAVDRISTEMHELAGRAKDLGSAAVFMTLLLWGYIWGTILLF